MRRTALSLGIALVVAWLGAGVAHAYPEYQLSRDTTCTGCHLSPAGGGLLNENGLGVAESGSQLGTAPEFMYGKIPTPKWLTLGGDARGAGGYIQSPTRVLTAFPMQLEGYATGTFGHVSVHVTFGGRDTERGNEAATYVWAREHYVMWQQKPGETTGLYARVGRFMPVYGLRIAEHPTYIRRYGGTQLYADTYGAHVALVEPSYEAHLTGFIKDPLIDPVEHYSGVMAYGELRAAKTFLVGAEGMFKQSLDDKRFGGGGIAKLFVPGAKLLFMTEVQYVSQMVDSGKAAYRYQLIGYLSGVYSPKDWLWLELALGRYDQNLRIHHDDRDCVDLNVHWHTTSHLELILTNRLETLSFGKGGPTAGYSLLQVHYRL